MREEEGVSCVGSASDEHASDFISAIRPRCEDLYGVQLPLSVLPLRALRQVQRVSVNVISRGSRSVLNYQVNKLVLSSFSQPTYQLATHCLVVFASLTWKTHIPGWLVVVLLYSVGGFGRQERKFGRDSSGTGGTAEKAA